MTRKKATAIGFTAVLMWALLALFTIGSAPTPPFLLNAICFAVGGTLGLVWTMRGPGLGVLTAVPFRVYVFGTLGLFGYHALYFTAFRLAPSAETGLIAVAVVHCVVVRPFAGRASWRDAHCRGAVGLWRGCCDRAVA
jgi:drug/metabolite transporter (DMT)-like permease